MINPINAEIENQFKNPFNQFKNENSPSKRKGSEGLGDSDKIPMSPTHDLPVERNRGATISYMTSTNPTLKNGTNSWVNTPDSEIMGEALPLIKQQLSFELDSPMKIKKQNNVLASMEIYKAEQLNADDEQKSGNETPTISGQDCYEPNWSSEQNVTYKKRKNDIIAVDMEMFKMENTKMENNSRIENMKNAQDGIIDNENQLTQPVFKKTETSTTINKKEEVDQPELQSPMKRKRNRKNEEVQDDGEPSSPTKKRNKKKNNLFDNPGLLFADEDCIGAENDCIVGENNGQHVFMNFGGGNDSDQGTGLGGLSLIKPMKIMETADESASPKIHSESKPDSFGD